MYSRIARLVRIAPLGGSASAGASELNCLEGSRDEQLRFRVFVRIVILCLKKALSKGLVKKKTVQSLEQNSPIHG